MVTAKDREILRRLAQEVAELSQKPSERESIARWKKVNSLEYGIPPIRITEIPWNEMAMGDELTLRCEDVSCREVEAELLQTIYQYRHFHLDNVIEPRVLCEMAVTDTGFGFDDDYREIKKEDGNVVSAFEYKPQIATMKDVEKLRRTVVTHDEGETQRRYAELSDIFSGILDVEMKGPKVRFFPWDDLIKLTGVEDGLALLYEDPDMIREAIRRLVDGQVDRLRQYEELCVLTLNNKNDQVGSGGLGYTDELPAESFDPARVRARDIWGSSAAQIFSSVSPRMHDEFALSYEKPLLECFGLSYYGCCDPLDLKVDMLSKVANLRKVSMSKWIDIPRGTEAVGGRYVFSYKPDPAVFAVDGWTVETSRKELEKLFSNAIAHRCHVEVIMKNISTLRYQPQRLIEWAQMAQEVRDGYYGR